MKKDILNYNNKGQLHGYLETYYYQSNKIRIRGNFKNYLEMYYVEWHGSKKTRYNKMKKTDIDNFNKKGNCHGYQEWYLSNDMLVTRVNFKNNLPINYAEWHGSKQTRYNIR